MRRFRNRFALRRLFLVILDLELVAFLLLLLDERSLGTRCDRGSRGGPEVDRRRVVFGVFLDQRAELFDVEVLLLGVVLEVPVRGVSIVKIYPPFA
jgi:hypothetical protein